MKVVRKFFVLVAFFSLAVAQDTPVFRTSTQLVQVSVIVRDKNGPVLGLTKDAFELFDKGKPQSIAFFQPPSPPGPVAPTSAPPPNLFSNRLMQAAAPRAATVLLIDFLNTQMPDQQYARKQVLKILSSLDKHQKIAVYSLSDDLKVLQDFTDDTERLVLAAQRLQSKPSHQLDGSQMQTSLGGGVDQQTDAILNDGLQQMNDFHTARRVEITLGAIERIASHMAGMSGAKSLIWITGSIPSALNLTPNALGGPGQTPPTSGGGMSQAVPPAASAPQSHLDALTLAVRAMNNTGLSIYPVDARGLVALPDSATAMTGGGSRASSMRSRGPSIRLPDVDTMRDLADRTGGKAFYGSNDISGAIRQVLDDADATYVLGFYPDSRTLDKKFHDLKVKVSRGSVDVRHRKSYYAGEQDHPSDAQQQTRLREAAVSPVDAAGVGIAAQIAPSSQPGAFVLRIAFELADLSLEHKDDKWKGAANLILAQQGNDGKILSLTSEVYSFDMKDETYRARLKEGLVVDKEIKPEPGLFQVRVLVADQSTGVIGSIHVPAPTAKRAP